jgi:uncharacterized protein YndB with AHSA1/START domain
MDKSMDNKVSNKPSFVSVSYIRTTPEKLWKALINTEFTRQYWFGMALECDWHVGSKFVAVMDGKPVITGEVLEFAPPRRLSYSWNPQQKEMAGEAASRVVFEISPEGEQVKLTVTHDGFPEKSVVFGSISTGWPKVLSSLKSLLETGTGLDLKSACKVKEEVVEAKV